MNLTVLSSYDIILYIIYIILQVYSLIKRLFALGMRKLHLFSAIALVLR